MKQRPPEDQCSPEEVASLESYMDTKTKTEKNGREKTGGDKGNKNEYTQWREATTMDVNEMSVWGQSSAAMATRGRIQNGVKL